MKIQINPAPVLLNNFHSVVIPSTDTEGEQVPTYNLLFYWLRCTNQNLDLRTNLKHQTETLEQM